MSLVADDSIIEGLGQVDKNGNPYPIGEISMTKLGESTPQMKQQRKNIITYSVIGVSLIGVFFVIRYFYKKK